MERNISEGYQFGFGEEFGTEEKIINPNLIASGEVNVGGVVQPWEVVVSRAKAVTEGDHFIFTTPEPRTDLSDEVKLALADKAIAFALNRNQNFRFIFNNGNAATQPHFHLQIIFPEGEDRLSKATTNVPNAIRNLVAELNLSPEKVEELENIFLQRPKN